MEGNKIIQYKNKPCIEASVVMLATNDDSHIIFTKDTSVNYEYGLDYYKEVTNSSNYNKAEPQHLYITSDEFIKEGDNVIYNNMLRKCINDSSIIHIVIGDKFGTSSAYPCVERRECKKIIATTDKSLTSYLIGNDLRITPQPSQAFIEAYVKANSRGFDKVLVEIERILEDMYDTQHLQTVNDGEQYVKTCKLISNKLLIDQNHNTITIHSVKPKVYTTEEVLELLEKYRIFSWNNGSSKFKLKQFVKKKICGH